MPSLEVVEVVLVQCNLVDKKHHRKSEVLYLFTPNKSDAYLLNVEPSNLVFLKTCNTEFDEIILTFFDQNRKSLEMEYKVNLALLINKLKLRDILYNQEQENMLKDMDFQCPLTKYKKQILDKGLDARKKVVHKAGEFIANKSKRNSNFPAAAVKQKLLRHFNNLNAKHPINNIEITNYFNYEPRFNGEFSRNNLHRIKDGAYVVNLDDKNSKGKLGFYYLSTKI